MGCNPLINRVYWGSFSLWYQYFFIFLLTSWLVVSNPLKNTSQIKNIPHLGVKIKPYLSCHHLDLYSDVHRIYWNKSILTQLMRYSPIETHRTFFKAIPKTQGPAVNVNAFLQVWHDAPSTSWLASRILGFPADTAACRAVASATFPTVHSWVYEISTRKSFAPMQT